MGRLAGRMFVHLTRAGGDRYVLFTLENVALGARSASGSVKVAVTADAYQIRSPADFLVTFQKPAASTEPASYQERVRLAAGDPILGALARTPLLVVLLLQLI